MQSTSYPLTQSDKLALSGYLSAGHEESAHDSEPLTPTYAPLSRAALSGNAPHAPRGYVAHSDYAESPEMDDEQDGDDEESLRDYVRTKQGRDYSPDYLPSMRDRAAIRSELTSMGCAWGE